MTLSYLASGLPRFSFGRVKGHTLIIARKPGDEASWTLLSAKFSRRIIFADSSGTAKIRRRENFLSV